MQGLTAGRTGLDPAAFRAMMAEVVGAHANLQVVATTLREVRSASVNDWGAILWHEGAFHEAPGRERLELLDRVGGGDSFVSGLAYGFLAGKGPQYAVECGAAHGALAMNTPGDTSMATLAEVEKVMRGGNARVER